MRSCHSDAGVRSSVIQQPFMLEVHQSLQRTDAIDLSIQFIRPVQFDKGLVAPGQNMRRMCCLYLSVSIRGYDHSLRDFRRRRGEEKLLFPYFNIHVVLHVYISYG